MKIRYRLVAMSLWMEELEILVSMHESNAGHHLAAENCWFGNSLGFGELKGAGQVHGRVSQFSAVITDAVARD